MTDIIENTHHCGDLIKRFDHDRYLTILYAPEDKRAALYALYAFNYEVSRIREGISEPMVGEIRLQWWREALDGIYKGKIRSHEIMPSLAAAIDVYDLSQDLFMAIIDGKVKDIYDENPENMSELETYLSQTAGNLSCLAVHILGQKDIDDLAQRLGLAWGYVGLIRSVAYHISLKKSYIPLNLMKKFNNNERFLSPDNPTNMKAILKEFMHQAELYLNFISENKNRIASQSRSFFLLSTLARSYMKSIEKADYNVFKMEEKADAFFRQWRLLMAALFKRI